MISSFNFLLFTVSVGARGDAFVLLKGSGQDWLDEYDDFINTVESMNIKRVIELKQAALDRFNK